MVDSNPEEKEAKKSYSLAPAAGQVSGSTLKAAIQSGAALHQGWDPASATGEKLGARSHADWEVLNREGRVGI